MNYVKNYENMNDGPIKPKVFLGGTVDSKWREEIIPKLNINYFNPIVKDWTPECQEEETRQKSFSDFLLYVITPKMTGVFSIAELVDDSNKNPDGTIFCYLIEDEDIKFTESQIKSLESVKKMILANGANSFNSLDEVADFLNSTDENKSIYSMRYLKDFKKHMRNK